MPSDIALPVFDVLELIAHLLIWCALIVAAVRGARRFRRALARETLAARCAQITEERTRAI